MKRPVLAVWLFSAIILVAPRAQAVRDSPARTGQAVAISGRVVADDTGDPLPNARVTLTPASAATRVVLSDAEGRFTLSASAGRHTVVASKSGYARRELTMNAGGDALEIRLPRGAAISGRVVDEFGDPVMAARVTAETRSPTGTTTVATTDTDDRGEYRLASLPAGAFVVAVRTIGEMVPTNVGNNAIAMIPTPRKGFYPGTRTATEAEELRLQPGDDRAGIDLRVPADPLPLPPVVFARAQQAAAAGVLDVARRGTGIIRGRVVSTDGRSVAHARLQLVSPADVMQSRVGRTDDDGRFEFGELRAGRFRVAASKTGFSPAPSDETPGASPAALASSRPIDLADGETRERVEVRLAPWGALTGRIFDEYGDPLQSASVQVLALRYEAGRRRLVAAGASARVTDDLGRYRLFGLAPGRYAVSAAVGAVSSADLPGYGRSYYPGTPNAVEAQFVSIGLSESVTGIDFSLSRTRTARVAGTLLNASGEPTTGGSVLLMPSQRSTSVTSVPAGARILPDGAFEFPNVPPGQYVIQAYRGRSNGWTEGEFGSLPVTVNGEDVTDLVLQTSSGSSIAGRFTFDTADRSKRPAPSDLELSPITIDADVSPARNTATANINDEWNFEIAGINGPRRLQLLRTPPGWALKEIRVNGIDVTDRPLPFGTKNQSLSDVEVVLTDRINSLGGTITDDRARPAPGAFFLVFATDRGLWYPASRYLRIATAGPDGVFTVTGLPFGNYYVVAIARLPADGEIGWQDPDFLESLLSSASTVTLGEGERQVVNMRLKAR
jgi:uncharacterized GH25 family protein